MKHGHSEGGDSDLPSTIVEHQLRDLAYRSALDATSRVLQPSLVDFLR